MQNVAVWELPFRIAKMNRNGMTKPSSTATSADSDDISAALDGDHDAYAKLVKRYQNDVSRWMWRFDRKKSALEELTQEVFLQAWMYLPKFKGKSAFRTWLFTIATRVGYRHWKQKAKDQIKGKELASRLAMDEEMSRMTPSEASEALYELLMALPPRDRLVLTLLYYEDMDTKEIARMTGWTRTMVKVQAHRARNKLRKYLQNAGYGGPDNG